MTVPVLCPLLDIPSSAAYPHVMYLSPSFPCFLLLVFSIPGNEAYRGIHTQPVTFPSLYISSPHHSFLQQLLQPLFPFFTGIQPALHINKSAVGKEQQAKSHFRQSTHFSNTQ